MEVTGYAHTHTHRETLLGTRNLLMSAVSHTYIDTPRFV